MSKNLIRDSIHKGYHFILYPKSELLMVMVGYFAVLSIFNILMSHMSPPMVEENALNMDGARANGFFLLITGMLRLLISLPLILYVCQKILLDKHQNNYFSYFSQKECWSLLITRLAMVALIGAPSFIILTGVYFAFTATGDTQLASGTALYLKMLNYILILPTVMALMLYFLMRFILINIHVSIGNSLDFLHIFKHSQGHAWKIFVSLLVTGLPAIILFWFSSGSLLMPSALTLTRPMAILRDLQEHTSLMDTLLRTVMSVLISYLLMASIAALCHLYKEIIPDEPKK